MSFSKNNSQYQNLGMRWTLDEEKQLVQEFKIQKLDINEIANIHKRKRGGIISRLQQLGLIDNTKLGRIKETTSSDSLLNIIVDELNKMENNLIDKIKYYKENREQLIRIKLLEAELQNLENQIQVESTIQLQKLEKNKKDKEYNQICIDSCKDAFKLYKLNLINMRTNPYFVQINSVCKKYYINYSFEPQKDNLYKVTTSIPYFPDLHDKKITGIYSEEKGLIITS